jgi:hypothetical protein
MLLRIRGFKSSKPVTSKNSTKIGRACAWLESAELFQTFEELDEVKDKKEEIRLVRQLIDENAEIKPSC